MINIENIKFGCIPSPKDFRDFPSIAGIPTDIILPRKYDLRDKIKYIRDQDKYGTCCGFAWSAIKNIQEFIEGDLPNNGGLSPLYIYTLAKQIDGYNGEGTYPRIIMKLAQEGILPEKDLPYDILLNSGKLPTIISEQKQKALPYKIQSYGQIFNNNIIALKQAIYTQGAVLGAIVVTDSFMYPEGKFINSPKGKTYGGHAICICGFDDDLEYKFNDGDKYKGFVLIQNSWGTGFGDMGFVWIPYDIFNYNTEYGKFCYELWTSIDFINKKEESNKPKSYYRVQLGAYSKKENAYKAQQDMFNKIGWKAYVTYIEPYWKLQFGAFSIVDNAKKMSEQLKGMGFNNWVTYY